MTGFHLRGTGKAIAFLLAHVGHQDDACVIWPFCRQRGYPVLSVDGKHFKAHRYMCELVNGPPPTPRHEAAHSCGNGHKGCVHPKHVSWKTKSENQLDRRKHGTHVTNPHGLGGKLKREQVLAIRALKGQKTQLEIATMFNISDATVRNIHSGRTWKSGGV